MRRGDIVIVADRGGGDFAGKPRPAVVVQADFALETASVVICPITTQLASTPLFRLSLPAGERTGLRAPSEIAVEKLTTVRHSRISAVIGRISDAEQVALNRLLAGFLGFG